MAAFAKAGVVDCVIADYMSEANMVVDVSGMALLLGTILNAQ